MKICLVLHKYSVDINDPCCFPLGYMYVSSYLKSRGHDVKILNYNLWDYDLKSEVRGYDIVGFTGFEEFKPYILRDSEICHDIGIRTVVGGALATFGEIDGFKGTLFRGEIDACEDIDSIPLPDYDGFGIEEYSRRHDINYMGVLTSRGCPYSCTFCAQTCDFRMRSIGSVMQEINLYKEKYNAEMICFNDNTLNINKPRFMKLCQGMKELNMPWGGAVRCQPFDEDMAIAAKESQCRFIVVGVESFNQDKLNSMNKKIRVKSIYNTLGLLNKHGLNYHGNLLVGFENESTNDIRQEIASIPDGYNIFPVVVQPFIGTKCGVKRGINEEEYNLLIGFCENWAISKGKTYSKQRG